MELEKNDGEILKLFLDGVDITNQLEPSSTTNLYAWNFSIPSEQVDTQQHSLVFYSVPAASADVNGDGAVNIAYVAALVNNIKEQHYFLKAKQVVALPSRRPYSAKPNKKRIIMINKNPATVVAVTGFFCIFASTN